MKCLWKAGLWLVMGLVLAAAAAGCGRKGPPFLPKPPFAMTVSHPEAIWQEDGLTVKGETVVPEGQSGGGQPSGCRVYIVHYPLNAPPCEGCPISYPGYQEVHGQVVKGNVFTTRLILRREPGIYFLEVRLLGPEGQVGPPSERVKFLVEKGG